MAVIFETAASGTTSTPSSGTISTSSFNATAGNLIVVTHRGSGTGTTPTDTAGNTYTRIGSTTLNNNVKMWYAYNITGNANNVVSLSVNNRDFGALDAVQYSGVKADGDPLETFVANNTNASSTATSNPFNTTSAVGVIVSGASPNTNSTSVAAGTNYTKRVNSSVWTMVMIDRIPGSGLTSEQATMSVAGSWNWGQVTAAFKAEVIATENPAFLMNFM